MRELPWSLKYAPRTPEESCVSPGVADELMRFLEGFTPKSKRKAFILYGPTGTGKTSLVYAAANVIGAEVLEINASDSRNKSSVKEILGPAIHQSSLFGGTKIILVDEIEGMSGTKDRGGATELASLVKDSSFPIIMTAHNPFDSKFSKLRSLSKMCEVTKIPFDSVSAVLTRIAENEGLSFDDSVISSLSRLSEGDVRGAINDMQCSVDGDVLKIDYSEAGNGRDTTQSIPEVMRTIFKSDDLAVLRHSLDNFEGNPDDVFMWIDYNIPKEYAEPDALYEAYDNLSKYDIYNSRIRKRQYWRYLAYMMIFLGCGVGLSKEKALPKQVRYEQNSRPLKIWMSRRKYAKRESISRKIASSTHWSTSEVIKNFEFYKRMAKDPESLKKMSEELGLDKDEISFLKQ